MDKQTFYDIVRMYEDGFRSHQIAKKVGMGVGKMIQGMREIDPNNYWVVRHDSLQDMKKQPTPKKPKMAYDSDPKLGFWRVKDYFPNSKVEV